MLADYQRNPVLRMSYLHPITSIALNYSVKIIRNYAPLQSIETGLSTHISIVEHASRQYELLDLHIFDLRDYPRSTYHTSASNVAEFPPFPTTNLAC